jgi:hypothetical protein
MSSVAGSIRLQMVANTEKLKKGIDESNSLLRGLRAQVGILNAAMGAMVGAKLFGAVADGIGFAVNAASDLNETINATRATFGDAADLVLSSGQDMADKFGIVRSEFYGAAAALGGIFKASGFNAQQAAEMSVQFVKLAADLASFKNLSFDEALQKIRAGLVGEAEPLRTVGVLLSEAAVKQEAYRKGIAVTGAELTDAQKVAARASIIMRQLSDAQGDLARTSGDYANSARALRGRMVNLAADAGSAFADVSKTLTAGLGSALAGLAAEWNKNTAAVKDWGKQAVAQGGMIYETIGWIGGLAAEVADMVNMIVSAFKVGIGSLGWLLAKVADGVGKLTGKKDIQMFAEELDKSYASIREQGAAGFGDGPGKGVEDFFSRLREGASGAAGAMDEVKASVDVAADATLSLAADVAKLNDSLREQADTFGMSSDEAAIYKLKIRGATDEELAAARGLSARLEGMKAAQKATEDLDKEAERVRESIKAPVEKLAEEFAKLEDLRSAGKITQEQFDRARAVAAGGKPGAGAAGDRGGYAGAVVAGTTEARSLLLEARGRTSDPSRQLVKRAEEQVAELRKINSGIGKLADAATGPDSSEAVM